MDGDHSRRGTFLGLVIIKESATVIGKMTVLGMVALLGSPKNCEYPSAGEGCSLDPYI